MLGKKRKQQQRPFYLVTGKSGAGKDYFVKRRGLRKVVSRTTRPPRPGEIDGKDFYFFAAKSYSKDGCEKKVNRSTMVTRTRFNGHLYWAVEEDLIGKSAYIVDPSGVVQFFDYNRKIKEDGKSQESYLIIVVYVDAPWWKRAYRMLRRGDGLRRVVSRLRHDQAGFHRVREIADIVIDN